jgi:hypothetical protein
MPPRIPIRVEAIDFATPRAATRPGVLSAVGIMSIILASTSLLFSGGAVFVVMIDNAIRSSAPAMAGAYSTTSYTIVEPAGPAVVIPDRMTPAARQIVISTLQRRQDLSEKRAHQLDLLLIKGGDGMFTFADDAMTPQNVLSSVTNSGQLPGFGGEPGNTFFVLTTGRIELADDHAVFSPTRGEPVRVYESPEAAAAAAAPPPSTMPAFTLPAMPPPASKPLLLGYATVMLVNAVLAVVLFVGGILILRDSRSGRRFHLTYAIAKLLITVGIGITMTMLYTAATGILFSIGGVLYPVALLLVFWTPEVRRYYGNDSGQWPVVGGQ